jgi:hypothetical protein
MQRREHQVAGFGGQNRRFDRFEVAHFADENHVGILPQRAAERLRERVVSMPISRWLHDRLLVAMEVLDRILDGDHVRGARRVDLVDHGRQRRALAADPVVPVTSTSPRSSWAIFGAPAAARALRSSTRASG